GTINPPVQAQLEAVQSMLLVAFRKSREQNLAKIRLAIAVSVGRKEDLRSARHQNTVSPGHDPAGEAQPVQKRRLFVVDSVAVLVFKVADDTAGLSPPVDPERIVPHLEHPELAVRPPIKSDRILDQRLRGYQLDREARRELDRLKRRRRRLAQGLNVLQEIIE